MVPDTHLEALKAKYELCLSQESEARTAYAKARVATNEAYAELDIYLNKAENSFQDTDAEGF